MLFVSFIAERAEVQPAEAIFLKSDRKKVVELGFKPGLPDFQTHFLL